MSRQKLFHDTGRRRLGAIRERLAPAEAKLADVVRTLKCNSSRWLHQENRLFAWQEGYGAFSVSPSQIDRVKDYIGKQAQHRRSRSFEDEFLAMLEAAKMGFHRDQFFGQSVAPEGARFLIGAAFPSASALG